MQEHTRLQRGEREYAAERRSEAARRSATRPWSRRWSRLLMLGAAGLILAGFLGLDRWFYEVVALRLNTPDPLDRDFYLMTKPLWDGLRYFPHVVGGAAGWLLILGCRASGWRRANMALLVVLLTALAANLLQLGIGRLRPNQADSAWAFAAPLAGLLEGAPVGSPSGEAATAIVLANTLRREFRRWGVLFYALAVGVLLARVLFGMHYISDVMAGVLLAALLGPFLRLRLLQIWRTLRARRLVVRRVA